jgi:hypothetical protein
MEVSILIPLHLHSLIIIGPRLLMDSVY